MLRISSNDGICLYVSPCPWRRSQTISNGCLKAWCTYFDYLSSFHIDDMAMT